MLYSDYVRQKMHNLRKVKIASGYPCILEKSLGKNLKDYKIYGNSYQKIPQKYQEVEYIQSTGTQYIDTGINSDDDNLSFDVKYSWTSIPTTGKYSYVFGSYDGEPSNTTRLLQYGPTITYTNVNVIASGGSTVFSSTRRINTIYNEILSKTQYISNGRVINVTKNTKGTTNNKSIFLFNANGTSLNPSLIKIYSFKVYNNETIFKNFVPCYRKSDNVIGMYDTVDNIFYVNQGTGVFLKGEDVIPTLDNPIEVLSLGENGEFNVIGNNNIKTITTTIDLTGHEPLRKKGDVADYIDYKNKRIVRDIGKIVLTENDDFKLYVYEGKNGILVDKLSERYNRQIGICNRCSNVGPYYSSNSMWIGVSNSIFYWIGILDVLGLTTIEEFKNWLKYNPTYIYYPLLTPIEEDFESPTVSTLKNTCTLTANDEEIQSSNIYAKYISK